MSRKCPSCAAAWPDAIKFCPVDGAELSEVRPDVPEDAQWEELVSKENNVPKEADSCEVGDTLGPYKLERLLGTGGMATVFEAMHERLERKVAIKVLNPEFTRETDVVQRFFNEAQTVNRIGNPNIVDITDFVEGGTHPPYMVMELLEGHGLDQYIREQAPIPAKTTVAIVMQICDAVAAVHEKGIIHRDLKPDNVMLIERENRPPKAKLLDFGIAKFFAVEKSVMTRSGELCGTPEYMPPEQIRGGAVDHRSDVYSLGIILYEMLSGNHPFKSRDLALLFEMQLNKDPGPPSTSAGGAEQGADRPAVPRALDDVVLACLAKDPDTRVQSMRQLRTLLKRSVEDDTGTVQTLLASTMNRKGKWIWAAAALCIVAVAALIAWWAVPRGRATSGRTSTTPGAPAHPAADAKQVRRIEFRTTPPGAGIYRVRDGKFMGRTPHRIERVPGHKVKYLLRMKGYKDQIVTADENTQSPLEVAIEPKDPQVTADAAFPPAEKKKRRRTTRRTTPRTRKTRPRTNGRPSRNSGNTVIVDPFKPR